MQRNCFGICSSSLLLLSLFSSSASAIAGQSCHYDASLGRPNLLGMRSYITAKEDSGNTTFVYEQFPSQVGENITIANRRELVFYKTNIQKARALLLKNKNYYSALVGYEDPQGFSPINSTLVCR